MGKTKQISPMLDGFGSMRSSNIVRGPFSVVRGPFRLLELPSFVVDPGRLGDDPEEAHSYHLTPVRFFTRIPKERVKLL